MGSSYTASIAGPDGWSLIQDHGVESPLQPPGLARTGKAREWKSLRVCPSATTRLTPLSLAWVVLPMSTRRRRMPSSYLHRRARCTGAVIAIVCCLSFLPKMYPAILRKPPEDPPVPSLGPNPSLYGLRVPPDLKSGMLCQDPEFGSHVLGHPPEERVADFDFMTYTSAGAWKLPGLVLAFTFVFGPLVLLYVYGLSHAEKPMELWGGIPEAWRSYIVLHVHRGFRIHNVPVHRFLQVDDSAIQGLRWPWGESDGDGTTGSSLHTS